MGLGRLAFWRRDRLRTCRNCEYTWRVPYALRRQRPLSKRRAGIGLADRSYALSQSQVQWAVAQAAARRAEHEKLMAMAAQLAVCPRCGWAKPHESKA